MPLKAFDSLTARLLVAGLVAGAVSTAGCLFLASSAEKLILENLQLSGLHLAARTAFAIAPLLVQNNRAEIASKMDLLRGERDMVAATVYNAQGQLMAETGFTEDRSCNAGNTFQPDDHRSEYHLEGPIEEGGERRGCLHLVISKERSLEVASDLWGAAFTAAALTLLVNLMAATSLSRLIAKPIERLAAAATEVGRGNLDTHIRTDERGEFGVVARAFEGMTSELRKTMVSKSHLADLINALGESLIVCDGEGVIQSANQAACQLLGYGWGDLEGMPMREVLAGDFIDPEHEVSVGIEREYITSRGGLVPVLTTVTAMTSQHQRLLLHVAQDLTQRKEVEAAMEAARQSAESANLAKSQFLANMTHELRTPLNSVISFAGLLEEELEDRDLDDLLPDVRKITRAGKHLLAVVNDVLDLSKIEAGRMSFHPAPFSLSHVVREVAETAEPLAGRSQNRLVVQGVDNDLVLVSDEQKFRQSLMNLLSNACKFTENGEVRVTCRAIGIDSHGHPSQVQVLVKDSGIGMSEQEMTRLFQPFTQVDSSAGRRFGGTGLGLAITHRFCRLMGGDLTVESQPGQGSTFMISLPITPPHADKADVELRHTPSAA